MKIFILSYQSPFIGNCHADVVHIAGSHLTVSELKEIIFEKNRIHPSQQRLTTKISEMTFVNYNS
jgi:hypothetical protein